MPSNLDHEPPLEYAERLREAKLVFDHYNAGNWVASLPNTIASIHASYGPGYSSVLASAQLSSMALSALEQRSTPNHLQPRLR